MITLIDRYTRLIKNMLGKRWIRK